MDIDLVLERIRQGELIAEKDALDIMRLISDLLFMEGTLHPLSLPIVICGDIHGQLHDLFHLFDIGGPIETNRYLFLGDYVDRGDRSFATIMYLFCQKLKYPGQLLLLRGNHECRNVNMTYGFYDEIVNLYGHSFLWRICNEVFDLLPMAALIGERIFCVHGGLSPDVRDMTRLTSIDRMVDLPSAGPMADVAWSDPEDTLEGWSVNARGAGWLFGSHPAQEFCRINDLELIARAHQIAMFGFQYHFGEEQAVTVWSAPNYMGRSGNEASVLCIDEAGNRVFRRFRSSPRPGMIPDQPLPAYFV